MARIRVDAASQRSIGILLRCAAFGALFAITACESIKVNSDYDHDVSFANYKTFSWISDHPMISKAPEVSPLAEGRIQRAITDNLTRKGMRYVADASKADVVIGFSVGAREKVSVTSNPYPAGVWPGAYGYHGWGGAYYNDVDVRQFTEGRLAIDVFDVGQKRPVWHGYGTKNVTSSMRKDPETAIHEAVTAILKDFPPGVAPPA
jgi:Domain of unknown function (DUF4136)